MLCFFIGPINKIEFSLCFLIGRMKKFWLFLCSILRHITRYSSCLVLLLVSKTNFVLVFFICHMSKLWFLQCSIVSVNKLLYKEFRITCYLKGTKSKNNNNKETLVNFGSPFPILYSVPANTIWCDFRSCRKLKWICKTNFYVLVLNTIVKY